MQVQFKSSMDRFNVADLSRLLSVMQRTAGGGGPIPQKNNTVLGNLCFVSKIIVQLFSIGGLVEA